MDEVFADTSALYALLVWTDDSHQTARAAASALRDLGAGLVASSLSFSRTLPSAKRGFVSGVLRTARFSLATRPEPA